MIYSVDASDVRLHVERAGEGPAVVLVPGGGGDAAMYRDLVRELARRFTVITFDRRGNSRSRWKLPERARSGLTEQTRGGGLEERARGGLGAQAGGVVAILDDAGVGRAFVFGNSAGALVTLSLITSHADRVAGAIVHEPPVIQVLPDAAERVAYFDDLRRIAEREGALPAMLKFAAGTMDKPTRLFDAKVGRTIGAAGVRLAKRLTPNNEMNRLFGNAELLMRSEMPEFVQYQPDLAALRQSTVRWAFGVGEGSEGRYYSRPAQQLSVELGVPCLEFPGGHLGYQRHAEEFARRLEEFIDG
jgi:pimeloyl-ACP methyl ester carboxylesterase